MAEPAYRIIDRRGARAGSNTLIQAATQNSDRKRVTPADYDFHRTISGVGRRTLMSLGRWMFWNIPALQGSILEQANLSTGTFIPQYWGEDKQWGDGAEYWLENWHKIGDIAGPPYDFDYYASANIILPLVDGDFGTILTEGVEGYPMYQIIPAHRIGSKNDGNVVVGGEYDGARIIDGVIVNDYGRAIAYRVYDEAAVSYTDISTHSMFITFFPLFPGQVRGLSLLASSAFDWQDIRERRSFEMLAQKAFSSRAIIETNETGQANPMRSMIATAATFNTDGGKATMDIQKLDGGAYTYFKSGSNSKLEAFDWNRPSANAQAFDDMMIRDAFRGTEWEVHFGLDPKSVGGAPMRIIVEKINAVLDKRRRVASKSCMRVDGYALSKAIKMGLLKENVDWWQWEYQGPQRLTADRKYDSEVDLQEVAQGFGTRKKACARRGDYYEDVDEQREREADSDLTRAGRLAVKHSITIQEALIVLRPPTSSVSFQSQPTNNTEADPADGSPDDE